MSDIANVRAIYRYPVKGLSPEPLARTALSPGQAIAHDRHYAIENGPSGFDPAEPRYLPKQRFLMLMRNARLAELRTSFDEATHTLTVHYRNREVARGDLRTWKGRTAIERFFEEFCGPELQGRPKVLHANGHSFSDVARKVVSIINFGTLAQLENASGAPIDPLRFRANLYVQGWPAWHEFDLVGSEIAVGLSARLKIVKRIVRCAATEVDPYTGLRDLPVPRLLRNTFGHADCGIYAEVTAAGVIAAGDAIR